MSEVAFPGGPDSLAPMSDYMDNDFGFDDTIEFDDTVEDTYDPDSFRASLEDDLMFELGLTEEDSYPLY